MPEARAPAERRRRRYTDEHILESQPGSYTYGRARVSREPDKAVDQLWTCPVDWSQLDPLHADHFEDLAAARRPTTKDVGVGPTGKLTEFRRIEIIEVRNGKIVRRWGEWDAGDHVGA